MMGLEKLQVTSGEAVMAYYNLSKTLESDDLIRTLVIKMTSNHINLFAN